MNSEPKTQNPNPEPRTQNPELKSWYCIEVPKSDYREIWKLQTDLVDARKAGAFDQDIVILLEHSPVFTLGRSGGKENLRVSESFLEKSGIPIVHVERGGNITYHGPGQLVGYPIINLKAAKLGVLDYVTNLEEVMIRTMADWGITAARNPLNRGIWVGNNKIGAIGVAVRRSITFHGFALNVNVSLEPFEWIHPCGLEGICATSMETKLDTPVSFEQVKERIKHHISEAFHIRLMPKDLSEVQKWLKMI